MLCQKLRTTIKLKNIVGCLSEINQHAPRRQSKNVGEHSQPSQVRLQSLVSGFCTEKLPRSANIFGDISGRKFEHFEMDEQEEEEEKFQDSEGTVPRRLKPSPGQYAKMIKSHISKKDPNSALKVFDLMKENRDKPTMYMYNLILRAFAMQGDIKKCYKLFVTAKKHQLQPNSPTFVSLLNACAFCEDSEVALEYLNKLRQLLYEQQFPLNQTHYNVMIKAYSWHNQILEAFQLADEMRDKRIPIEEITYNSLFHAAISDKKAGLRHALIVWHLMRLKNVKPSVRTYNLLLRSMRDTNFGDLRLDDVLVTGADQTKILLKDGERPDLLASPPFLSTLLPMPKTKENSLKRNDQSTKEEESSLSLNDIPVNNRLILFGGLDGFLARMNKDGVAPDAKTVTLLLDLIPASTAAENLLVKTANDKGIELDIDFCNMLIKRRSMRHDYKAAKEVISMAEQKNLTPNVMTFGVLALGCQKYHEAKEFLEGLEAFGYKPNSVIVGTLINTACHKRDFEYLLFVMNYMMENKIKPNEQAIKDLKEFSREIPRMEVTKNKHKHKKKKRLEENAKKFEEDYLKWQKMREQKSFVK
ncbi:pentatricopeptide repeat-containing protein 1, mitochondrial [Pseudomyrmex gracilis]|uniref:pentatricopeptide repeat-containing protein 1, mitochondrial n=1 Tax=Pseudomyrmex gracilis TaxID=219809 RepID=UPI000994FE5F|nr:pentatricopeptide repeat-containing protein 1, mitochondrial [Pseudomyrmex gracilis]